MSGETLVLFAWRAGRRPIPGDIQGHVGQGSGQSNLVADVPVTAEEVEISDS